MAGSELQVAPACRQLVRCRRAECSSLLLHQASSRCSEEEEACRSASWTLHLIGVAVVVVAVALAVAVGVGVDRWLG